jgi:hypothetical protein
MYLIDLTIFCVLEITNVFFACYLINYLYKKKDKFPYANVSPLWIITFITGKINIKNLKLF